MKRILILPVMGILMLGACKEVPPAINFNPSTNVKDTTYMAAVEAPQARSVLIEDFTGVSCPNCPEGHAIIDGLVAQYPQQINVLGIYPNDFGQAYPLAGHSNTLENSVQDFRTAYGTQIGNVIYGALGFMPCAGIDRVTYNNNLLLDRAVWSTAVNARLAIPPAVNLRVTSSFVPGVDSTGIATIKATVAFTQNMITKQNLSIAIVEDSIVDQQEDGTNANGIDIGYVFKNVFRDFATINNVPYGNAILATQDTIKAGTVFEETITYTLPAPTPKSHWVPAHCKVVATVNYTNSSGTKTDILQSATCKLAP